VLKSHDLEAFRILEGSCYSEYAGDGEKIFREGKQIRGAHGSSFRVMRAELVEEGITQPSAHFARDRNRIYFDGKPLKGVNYERFRVIRSAAANNTEFGTDCALVFFKDWARNKMVTIMPDALPAAVRNYLSME
jgi:hypothetical protein